MSATIPAEGAQKTRGWARRPAAACFLRTRANRSVVAEADRGPRATHAAKEQHHAFSVPAGDARRLNEEELKRLTKEDLVRLARHADLPHRSKMNKAQLARSLRRYFRRPSLARR